MRELPFIFYADNIEAQFFKSFDKQAAMGEALCCLKNVQLSIKLQRTVCLTQVVREIGAHERQGENSNIQGLLVKGHVGYVTCDDVIVDSHMINAVDRVTIRYRLGQQRLTTPKISNHLAASLLAPADHLLIGDDGPLLAFFPVQRVVLGPFLGIGLKALVRLFASSLVPEPVHRREFPILSVSALSLGLGSFWKWHDDLGPRDRVQLTLIETPEPGHQVLICLGGGT